MISGPWESLPRSGTRGRMEIAGHSHPLHRSNHPSFQARRYDFSENNEKNLHGFDVPINLGGNDFMATAYLARWSGPVSEAADPYSYGTTVSPSGLPVEKHVQEVFFIPTRREPLDNDLIKSAVRQYGAVYSTLRYEASSYNPGTAAYYYSGSGTFNHAIDIVGWDDGYSASNFNNPPPGNGAFIARNSWGSTWGDAGYFYISYYDTRIGRDNAMFTAESPNNYSRVYQYDPLGWVANFGFGSDTAYYANVFTSAGNEQLKAVGFYTSATNTQYEVKVFLNPGYRTDQFRWVCVRTERDDKPSRLSYHPSRLTGRS